MTGAEQGFLLLTSHLGDPNRKVLTVPQLRNLGKAVLGHEKSEFDREMTEQDLMNLGYNRESACRILSLLSSQEQVTWYLETAAREKCYPVSRISDGYPAQLKDKLGLDSPGCLWLKGDPTILCGECIAVVGSRDLSIANREFAEEAGRQIALQGLTLVSGNAKGADSVAQEACLNAGGQVISVVADCLKDHPFRDNVLFVSEDGFDLPFSAQRALSRNRIIHCLGEITLIAQCSLEKGGTWDGTTKNLRYNWSEVYCFQDDRPAFVELMQRGAFGIQLEQLSDLRALLQCKSQRIHI